MLGEREQNHYSLHLVGQEYSSKTIEKHPRASQVANSKESACQYRRRRLNPWDRKVSWRKKWQPTQYSCMENSMERGAWWATVRRVTKSQTRLSHWTHTHTHTHKLCPMVVRAVQKIVWWWDGRCWGRVPCHLRGDWGPSPRRWHLSRELKEVVIDPCRCLQENVLGKGNKWKRQACSVLDIFDSLVKKEAPYVHVTHCYPYWYILASNLIFHWESH